MEALQAARTNKSFWGEVVSYLMVTAVVVRGLAGYPEIALQITGLVAIYILLILTEPFLRRQSGWGQPLFILGQIGVMAGLFILTPLGDFWAVMLLPACIYVMRHYRRNVVWAWLLTFLGFASHHLDVNNRFLQYATEAVLPSYILHQTIIVVIGYLIVDWQWATLPKYLFLAATSFVTIMVLYEFLVRRVDVLRFAFGMKG